MARKKTDQDILASLRETIQSGVKFLDTKLARERQKVMDYYNGVLPKPVHAGNSKYVSTDVFDTVESLKANLLETFSAGNGIVQFSPDAADYVPLARMSTAYADHVVFELNSGTALFSAVIHDGLTARVGIAQVYWDERIDEIEREFKDIDEDQLAAILQNDKLEAGEIEIDEDTGLISGTVVEKVDNSQICVEPVPAEEFVVNPQIKTLKGAEITRRMEKTRSELKAEGYDPAKIAKLSRGSDNTLETDPERITRFDPVSDGFGRTSERRDGAEEILVIYETYIRLDLDGSGSSKLWRIVHDNSKVILEREQVERHPFITFCPLPTPHSFYGANLAEKAIPIQNSKTVLTRSIIDHATITNNPRYKVVRGALTNPRELLDNRIGGIVNVTRADGIMPLDQANMNPFVFQTIEMLDTDKEDATGVSRLSKGLNKDAISKQNSRGMVEDLVGLSQIRQKTIAREFANQFLKPLYVEIIRLAMEYETKERMLKIAGEWVPVNPSDWDHMCYATVDLKLGYGERDATVQDLLGIHQMIAGDPQVQHLYGPQQRYNVYKSVLETKGHKDVDSFIANPATVPPPEPDPMVQAEIALKQAQAKEIDGKLQISAMKEEHAAQLAEVREDFEKRFQTLEFMLKARDADRKDAETANRIEVAEKEMELAERAENEAPDENIKSSAIISPNG
jgi:hypothetical protein